MGLFGGKKKTSGGPRVIGFLCDADDAYMLAFDSKNIKPFAPYADPAVCNALLEEILSGEDRYFGSSKLRKREWKIVLDDGRVVQAVKSVSHTPVATGFGGSIDLGDTIEQEWDVEADGKKYKVIKIGRPKQNGAYHGYHCECWASACYWCRSSDWAYRPYVQGRVRRQRRQQ